jgi:hypothetical protein
MAKNIETNTPKIVIGLMLATSLPVVYLYYQAMWDNYRDINFYGHLKKTVDGMNL